MNFRIIVGTVGSKTGMWSRSQPTPIESCSPYEIYEALIIPDNQIVVAAWYLFDGSYRPGNGLFNGSINFFVGKIELYGGESWDGIYDGINDLPVAGWTPVTANLFATVVITKNVPSARQILNVTTDLGGTFIWDDASDVNPEGTWEVVYAYNEVPDAFHLLTSSIGIDIQGGTDLNTEVGTIENVYIQGTYEIQRWTTTITSPTEIKTLANIDVQPIESVVIESDPEDPDAVDFTQLDPTAPITLYWELENANIMIPAIITITTYYLEFIIDVYLLRLIRAKGKVPVAIKLNGGTQFEGQVLAGTLEILFFDGTGVYKISSGRRNDLIYVEEDVTEEFKIPDPTIKTGYIGT